MAHRRSAVKKLRQDKKRTLRNLKIKNKLKDTIKKYKKLLAEKQISSAKEILRNIYSQLDKAAKKNIIHKNKAHRLKSRLSLKLSKITESQN